MIEREVFVRHVQDALDHLYDLLHLQRHPLTALLAKRPTELGHGRMLHRFLLEAIEALQPPRNAAYNSPAARKYRYLSLRYVESRTVAEICEDLGISERQSRRYHTAAVESVASVLWERYLHALRDEAERADEGAGPERLERRAERDALQAELLRVADGGEPSPALDAVVSSALETVSRLASEKGTRLVTDLRPGLPPVGVHGVPLRQAVINLLLFATKWAQGGDVHLSAEADDRTATLRIVATPPRFEPTRDAGEAISGDEQLDLARTLTESEGGRLYLAPQPLGALAIVVSLPVARRTVLVVDDNPEILELFGRYLARSYTVLEARAGREALSLALERRPQAITLDVMMPSQDGWQMLQLLKNREETTAIPVIVCSVLRDRDLALSLGAAEFLAKPVSQADLLEALARCLAANEPPERRG